VAIWCALALCTLVGCSSQPVADAQSATPEPAVPATAPQPGPTTITGTVAETIDAANYTYVRISTGSEDVWVAASPSKVAVGEKVAIPTEMRMENFHSQALNRDFPVIYFAPQIAREGEALPVMTPQGAAAMSSHGNAQGPAPVVEPIAPPEGGMSVADVWADRKTLAGKSVVVRGKVVKYNAGIMGANWIHLQDGSGDAAARTNDLTITSTMETRVGDVVTATGTVAIDKDLGSGYVYEVIVENATLAMP
jgi:hypothetical protein